MRCFLDTTPHLLEGFAPARSLTAAGSTLPLDLPSEWTVIGSMEPNGLPPVPDPDAAVREALANPIGMVPLRDAARDAKRVAIVVDDVSRPTPVHHLMPGIVAELAAAGVPEAAITVVTALGTHRPMTAEEVGAKIGAEWATRLRWENHDYADPNRNVRLGTTTRGTPVYVNATVAAADLVLLLGLIEPHLIASFGGGYKNLIPGVAGAQTIAATHTLNLTRETFNMAGRPCESNPMRLDLEEGGMMLGKPVFIVNTVLDTSLRIVRVVAGDPVAAHREGARTSAEMCGVTIPGLADVVIASSYPMDMDLRQGLKSLANSISAVRPGGLLIVMIRAEEGLGHMDHGPKPPVGRRVLRLLAPLLLRRLATSTSASQGQEHKFFAYFGLQALRRNDVLIYAPEVPRSYAPHLPIADMAWSLDQLWSLARKRAPRRPSVLIAPAGGVTYPVLRTA